MRCLEQCSGQQAYKFTFSTPYLCHHRFIIVSPTLHTPIQKVHNKSWRIYESEVDQRTREHLVEKFLMRDGQSRGVRIVYTTKFPSIHRLCLHLDAPIQKSHNE